MPRRPGALRQIGEEAAAFSELFTVQSELFTNAAASYFIALNFCLIAMKLCFIALNFCLIALKLCFIALSLYFIALSFCIPH